ncbi:unnamed protein product [Acanthoscelides obtectus]|uniref:Uncharacterized protein n=1 Tax=Acanthoscelides obtectus TaxID=200917 RepID=A0A9P0Q421_ACAOB|nr:unnamed protein product [Acanthoscelides obtectus]CAK1659683.1 hypothetical protein AOBTE_LOCUS21620 [Acanthoscelides obtectus]
MFDLIAQFYRRIKIIVGHLQEIFQNCPPSSKTKSSTVCFTFTGGGRNLLSSNLNRPLLGRQHSVFLHFTI